MIRSRTAVGPRFTKLEARPQPFPVKTGISIWDLKVFNLKDDASGTRKEWQFFNQLPQNTGQLDITQVLMRAWIISDDNGVFQPRKPSYKAYGSFVSDWNLPRAGDYTLFVEYQPAESDEDHPLKASKIHPIELARWKFKVAGEPLAGATLAPSLHADTATQLPVFTETGEKTPYTVQLPSAKFDFRQGSNISGTVRKAGAPLTTAIPMETTFLSPDREHLLHFVSGEPRFTVPQRGIWYGWFSFQIDETQYLAPFQFEAK